MKSTGLVCLFAAVLGSFGLAIGFSGCHVDPTVSKPIEHRDLALDEIRGMLRSGDFKQRLEASKQIEKLPLDEKLRVLDGLAVDPDPAVRLMAAKKLRSIDDPRAKATRETLKNDADPDVRAMAGS